MSGNNSFGKLFTWTTFGESHGAGMGVVIDGCPAGIPLDLETLQRELNRRRPGQKDASSKQVLVSARDEADQVQILSGVYAGKTLGTPIACLVKNENQRSEDYEALKENPRQGHADDVWKQKFGHVDHRGGGRSSGRETLSRVIAGSVAKQFLKTRYPEIQVNSFVRSIGTYEIASADLTNIEQSISQKQFSADEFTARFPYAPFDIADFLLKAKQEGESYGGVVETWIDGCPMSLGEPVFYKIKNVLASAMMSIGATCGFEMGDGFAMSRAPGSQLHRGKKHVYGGVRGGISTGERIIFRVAFKPTSSILDVAKVGRHDPCIVPRAVPVVDAMTWAVLADMVLLKKNAELV